MESIKTAQSELLGVDAEDNIKALNEVVRPPSCMLTTGT